MTTQMTRPMTPQQLRHPGYLPHYSTSSLSILTILTLKYCSSVLYEGDTKHVHIRAVCCTHIFFQINDGVELNEPYKYIQILKNMMNTQVFGIPAYFLIAL